ncbi:MAG: MFS transporter [Betaproteobacteria bacterium]|nr:MAG: MFS transporter [Betaproteobacteria bacterium]
MTMRTSYRDIFLLACCQALLLVNNASLIAMNGLVGYALAGDKAFATAGVTTFVLGSALSAMPAALWMAKVGRRRGFMTGSIVAVFGSAICALALAWSSFALFCLGTAIIGVYTAFGLQYRFAAAEVAAPEFKAKAISLVLAGGIAGGFLGPEASRWAKDLLPVPFLGSFIVLSGIALIALGVQSRVRVPAPSVAARDGGRSLSEIARQPVFVVAVLSAALGYGVMNLLMTATPLAMSFCGYPWVIVAGTLLMVACVGVALADNQVGYFWAALVLLGVGWNLMYTGGTTLLTEVYTPAEKAKTQGLNDFIVFAVMGLSSFSAGALIDVAGWERMNAVALPFVAVVMFAALWLFALRRSIRPPPKAT